MEPWAMIYDVGNDKQHLTHYSLVLLFYTPWRHQKTFRFLGGIEMEHRALIG